MLRSNVPILQENGTRNLKWHAAKLSKFFNQTFNMENFATITNG